MTEIAGPAGIFQPGNPFSALATAQFATASAEAIGLSLISNPSGFSTFEGPQATVLGASTDTPFVVFQPIQLSLANVVTLAQAQTGLDLSRFFGAAQLNPSFQALETRQPPLANLSAIAIENTVTGERAVIEIDLDDGSDLVPIDGPALQFLDALTIVSENQAFGSTFSSIAFDASLNTIFDSRVGVSSGGSVTLSDLVFRASDGTPENFAVRLRGENGSAPAGQLTQGGTPLADNVVIAAADLSSVFFEAPSNGFGLDTISFVELNDSGSGFDGRGLFQTTTVTFIGQAEARRDLDERIVDFFFATQPGTGQTRVVLDIAGINSQGFTDALSAINGGVLRIQGFENLSDGSRNNAVTSLLESNGNSIILNFPFATTRNGITGSNIQVELRSLDLNFDISTATARATFA